MSKHDLILMIKVTFKAVELVVSGQSILNSVHSVSLSGSVVVHENYVTFHRHDTAFTLQGLLPASYKSTWFYKNKHQSDAQSC